MPELFDVEGQSNPWPLQQSNNEAIEERLWSRKPSKTSGVFTTQAGPPTSGAWLVNNVWRDAHLASWICTVAGAPGTWSQNEPGIGSAFPVDIPDGYRLQRWDQNWIEYIYNAGEDSWSPSVAFVGTASRAVVTDEDGKLAASDVTATDIGRIAGVRSSVQDQIDATPFISRLPIKSGPLTTGTELRLYGDSITAGQEASDPSLCYASLVSDALGLTQVNHGVGGRGIIHHAGLVLEQVVGMGDLYIYALGIGDFLHADDAPLTRAQRIPLLKYIHLAGVASLAIPDTIKKRGDTFTATDWSTADTAMPASIQSSMNGATLDCGTFYGDRLLLSFTRFSDPNGGQFNVIIDGVSYGPYDSQFPVDMTVTFSTDDPNLKNACFLSIFELPLGHHTMEIEVISPTDAGNIVEINYVTGLISAGGKDWPAVYVDNMTQVAGSFIAFLSLSDPGLNEGSKIIAENCKLLASLGLNVFLVDTMSALDPDVDLADGIHPNDGGYAKLADVFLAAMRTVGGAGSPTGDVNEFQLNAGGGAFSAATGFTYNAGVDDRLLLQDERAGLAFKMINIQTDGYAAMTIGQDGTVSHLGLAYFNGDFESAGMNVAASASVWANSSATGGLYLRAIASGAPIILATQDVERARIESTGLKLAVDLFLSQTPTVPGTSGAAGTKGQIAYDGTYLYLCINTNTWRRTAHATW